jgi:hypothetical protein
MTEKEFYRWLDVDSNVILLSQKESHHDVDGNYERIWVIDIKGTKHKIVEVGVGTVIEFHVQNTPKSFDEE